MIKEINTLKIKTDRNKLYRIQLLNNKIANNLYL